MTMTYTYDLDTDVGKLRFLIQDHDMSSIGSDIAMEKRSAAFSDEELQFVIDREVDLYESASLALLIWANNKQLIVVARRNSKASLDYGSIRSDLLKASEAYHIQALQAPADATVEQSWTLFSERRIIWNEMLRTSGA